MTGLLKAVVGLVLFVVWVPVVLIAGYFLVAPLVFGRLGLPLDYEMPFMGLIWLICLGSFPFLLDLALRKVSR